MAVSRNRKKKKKKGQSQKPAYPKVKYVNSFDEIIYLLRNDSDLLRLIAVHIGLAAVKEALETDALFRQDTEQSCNDLELLMRHANYGYNNSSLEFAECLSGKYRIDDKNLQRKIFEYFHESCLYNMGKEELHELRGNMRKILVTAIQKGDIKRVEEPAPVAQDDDNRIITRNNAVKIEKELVLMKDTLIVDASGQRHQVKRGSVVLVREIYSEQGGLIIYLVYRGMHVEVGFLSPTGEKVKTKKQLMNLLDMTTMQLPKFNGKYPPDVNIITSQGPMKINIEYAV